MQESAIRDIVAAYRAATYAIRLPGGRRVVLRVDAPGPRELDPLLDAAAHGTTAGFITTWNPFSQPAPRAENHGRQRVLLARLRGSARVVLAAAGFGTGWREPSLAVFAIEPDELDSLAREFRQNAILSFRARERVRLRLFRDDWRKALADSDVDFAPPARG